MVTAATLPSNSAHVDHDEHGNREVDEGETTLDVVDVGGESTFGLGFGATTHFVLEQPEFHLS